MFSIKENTIGEAWLKALALVVHEGHESLPDDKGMIRELLTLIVHMSKPVENDRIIQQYGNREILSFMKRNFRDLESIPDWKYSYAERLYDNNGINQIANVIEILRSNAFSKSATISLINSSADIYHRPCLVTIDFKVRHETLFVMGFFRSQDIGKKMYADALELLHIGNIISVALRITTIEIIHFISSAHIYEVDRLELLRLLEEQRIE
jgi:thymidylate synthase